jgi:hypothetical protein
MNMKKMKIGVEPLHDTAVVDYADTKFLLPNVLSNFRKFPNW